MYTNTQPMESDKTLHAVSLKAESQWLRQIIAIRTDELSDDPSKDSQSLYETAPPPELPPSYYRDFMAGFNLSLAERVLVAVSLNRIYAPTVFAPISEAKAKGNNTLFAETGMLFDKQTGALLPTLQTVVFLLAGNNKQLSAEYQEVLNENNLLMANGIVRLINPSPFLNDTLFNIVSLDRSYYAHFVYGKKIRLDEMENFPAQLLETDKTFNDLILHPETKTQLNTVMNYARHYKTMHQQTGGGLQGYVAMFYGPPGTGKTMTASVIGKELGLDVYAVNLSRVVSKYIGETEKNLEVVFDRLSRRDCILFFDEADSLFGKRSEVTEANDRYANQEIAYLLQKIDKCNCLVILATNFRQNMDAAFTRRILSYIRIDWPGDEERKLLWGKALMPPFKYQPETLPETLAAKYAITGANIYNITKLTCYEALAQNNYNISLKMLEPFIKLEYTKERRSLADPLSWPMIALA